MSGYAAGNYTIHCHKCGKHKTGMDKRAITCKECAMEEKKKKKAELDELRTDAENWRWLVRHASLGFDGAPSWNAVIRLPVFDSEDQTITALVDRARALVGD